jgi:hypothetical protein
MLCFQPLLTMIALIQVVFHNLLVMQAQQQVAHITTHCHYPYNATVQTAVIVPAKMRSHTCTHCMKDVHHSTPQAVHPGAPDSTQGIATLGWLVLVMQWQLTAPHSVLFQYQYDDLYIPSHTSLPTGSAMNILSGLVRSFEQNQSDAVNNKSVLHMQTNVIKQGCQPVAGDCRL